LKYINFVSVKFENYCNYIDPMEFQFENGKITLITGPNGIGKSTIFGAIPFALYGVTPTGQRPDDVLNNKTQKNCRVDCLFEIDNDKYMVSRTVKYKNVGSTAFVYKKGIKEPLAKGYREVTNFIENLLIPKDLFLNTVLFGQKVKTFFTDLPDSKQKEIFRKILQLDNYVMYQKNVNSIMDDLKIELNELQHNKDIILSKIDVIKIDTIDTIEGKIKHKLTEIENLKWNNNLIKKDLEEEKEKLINLKESEIKLEFDNLTNLINSCNNQLDNLNSLLDSKKNELENEKKLKISEHKEKILQIEKTQNDLKNNIIKKLSKAAESKIEINQQKLEDLREKYLEEKNIIVDNYNEQIKKIKDEFAQKIESNNFKINDATNFINEINVNQSKLSTVIDFASTKIKEYKNAIDNKQSICPTCFQQWDDVSHIQKLIDEQNEIIIEKTAELNKLLDDKKHYQEIINQLTSENNEYNKNLDLLISELEDKFNKEKEKFDLSFKEKAESIKILISEIKDQLKQEIENIEKEFSGKMSALNEDLVRIVDEITIAHQINLQDVLEKFGEKRNKILLDIKDYKEKLSNLKLILSQIEAVKNKITTFENDIEKNEYSINDIKKQIEEHKQEINNCVVKIESLYNEIGEHINRIDAIKENIKICNFWKVGFSSSGIPSMLIDESIPFMNERIGKYLEQMSHGRYHVTFDTLKETKKGEFRDKISIHVYDSVTHSNSRVNFSGGQIRLVDIATILTLSDLQEDIHKFKINISLFDEIFDALDDQNTVNVSHLLRKVLIKDKAICLITHRLIDQIEADNIYALES